MADQTWDRAAEAEPETEEFMEFAPEGDDIFEFGSGEDEASEPFQGNGGNSCDKELLKEAGVDIGSGLKYCAGDESLYFEMLGDFVSSLEDRLKAISGFYKEEGWHDYEVAVHALKSNARTVGINATYEKARLLEEAAEKGDTGYIRLNHGEMIKEAEAVAERIRQIYEL